MKRATTLLLSFISTVFLLSGTALPGAIPPQVEQSLSQGQRNVIVILRDQLPNLPPARRAMGARASALAASQSSMLASFPQMRGRKVVSFSTINAFAARVSAEEAQQLAAHPMVQAVVPDAVIKPPRRNQFDLNSPRNGKSSAGTTPADGGLCNTLEPQALQLTNAAFADATIPQAHEVRDGNGQKVRGKGVKVAFLADALDPTVQGFIRPNGSPVFVDYQDFSGDPAGTPTAGGEAFGDASSIAAQDMPNGKPLIFDISKFVNEAHPLPSPCNIRIRGMAPDASLVGLVVFGGATPLTNSNFVQAIEYAVIHDDVDVINESFGGNPFPDNANDPISLANDAAVRAGTTVVVSTGDAGAKTLQSPASESSVIAAGSTNQYRIYAQTSDGTIPLAKNGGFTNNNIATFSSSGFSQRNARMLDVVAPGDSGWALCSTDQAMFGDCGDFTNEFGATPIEVFGGTSESSPLTAGLAALVIQAYRSTHRGADPSPALVKRIIKSTATDLSTPSSEQGAGLINALAAVNLALSTDDEYGKGGANGTGGLLVQPTSVQIIGAPDHPESRSFTFTNTGNTPQHLTPALEKLDAPFAGQTLNVNLNPATDPTFVNAFGGLRPYHEQKFKVPAGADHLDVAIAFPTPLGTANTPTVVLGLLDPAGRQAAYDTPQGVGQAYGSVDVNKPMEGTWTAIIFTHIVGTVGSYTGPVQLTWGAERFVAFGSISPAHLVLPPGGSASVTAEFSMPSEPGDLAAAIRFDHSPNAAAAKFPDIPVALRALISTGPTGGTFTGTLTGGNGRGGAGPYQTFEFNVPKGVNDMSLVLNIADNGYLLEGLLVDPNGMQLSVQPNQDPLNGSAQFALSLAHYNPQPGRWKFVLLQNFFSSGNQTSLPFTARIGFNAANVAAPTLPNSPSVMLSASASPVTIPIQVVNTGALTRLYFADARLTTTSVIQLPPQTCSSATTLPGACGAFIVPTQTSAAALVAQSTVPITMDAFNDVGTVVGFTGSPDIYAKTIAPFTVAASISEPEVPYSFWLDAPSQIGPYGPAGAPTVPVTNAAAVLTQSFDSAVSAGSGDFWADLTLNTNTFNPLILAPGAAGTINLTITPDPSQVGKTVSGFIFIDTFDFNVFTGDETARLPYSYTVAP
ncbi:MAG TPA: S8 family serine peptidase [Steroidobacteraceae bacterium]